MKVKDIYKRAIQKWGSILQINMAIEECAELIVVLQHRKRIIWHSSCNGTTVDDVLEEMADVEIMLEQLKLIYNHSFQLTAPISKFDEIKQRKLKRLERRLT